MPYSKRIIFPEKRRTKDSVTTRLVTQWLGCPMLAGRSKWQLQLFSSSLASVPCAIQSSREDFHRVKTVVNRRESVYNPLRYGEILCMAGTDGERSYSVPVHQSLSLSSLGESSPTLHIHIGHSLTPPPPLQPVSYLLDLQSVTIFSHFFP